MPQVQGGVYFQGNIPAKVPAEVDISSPSTSSSSSSFQAIDVTTQATLKEAVKRSSERQLAFCGEESFKKACRQVYNLNLRDFLEGTVPGKFILNFYNQEGHLSRKTRNQLTSILITGILSENG